MSGGRAARGEKLSEGQPADFVMAETAYDGNKLRAVDKYLRVERHLVECYFSGREQFRRVVTRFEKTARNCFASVAPAAIILWNG
jgi:transposase